MGEIYHMSDKKVTVNGIEYDYGNMNNKEIIELFTKLKKKELSIYKKLLEVNSKRKHTEG